jgi:hypothetical protein
MRQERGQILIGAIIVLVVLSILIPAIIMHVQHETDWAMKEQRSTRAFQLAETAVERGFQQLILSTGNWTTIQGGGTVTNYNFDHTYTDMYGGSYEIKIEKTGTQAATITGVARDTLSKEIRAVQAVYGNSASNAAIFAEGGITLTSNPGVEWGPVNSPSSIDTTQVHPRFYSAGNIANKDTNGAAPPNSDNVQWWSYYPNLPPAPEVDLQTYLSSATTQGHLFPNATYPGPDYRMSDICGAGCVGSYYFTGDTTLKTPSGYVGNGAIVVIGNLTLQGSAGNGNYSATLPANAWKEYGNDWAFYRTNYDGGAPATFPGINGTYTHGTITSTIDNVLVHGFLYVNDAISISGGGNMSVHGSMYIGDSTSLDGSHVKVYYDDSTTILTKNVSLVRASWNEIIGCDWTAAHVTCP